MSRLLNGLNRAGFTDLKPYLLLGAVLWFLVFLSGIHATLAGVALALTIPLRVSPGKPEDVTSPLHRLEHALQPWVALGLFVGKQVGIFAFSWLTIRTAWAHLPANAAWAQFYGVALLCGIGFTMSLFIGLLAFPTSPELQDATKLGGLLGSGLSALTGAALLGVTRPEAKPTKSQ